MHHNSWAHRVFEEEFCDNCTQKAEHPEPPQVESIDEYIERLRHSVSSFAQHDKDWD